MGGERVPFSSGGIDLPKKRPEQKGGKRPAKEGEMQPLKRLIRGMVSPAKEKILPEGNQANLVPSSSGPAFEESPVDAQQDENQTNTSVAVGAETSGNDGDDIPLLTGASAIILPHSPHPVVEESQQLLAHVNVGPSDTQFAAARTLDDSMKKMDAFVRQGLEKVLNNMLQAGEIAVRKVVEAAASVKDEAIRARDEALTKLSKTEEEIVHLRSKVKTTVLAARHAKESEEAAVKRVNEIQAEKKGITNELLKAHQLVTKTLCHQETSDANLAEAKAEIERLKAASATISPDVRRHVDMEFFQTSGWKKSYASITNLDLDIYWGRIHLQIKNRFEVTPDDPRLAAMEPNFDEDGKLACQPPSPHSSDFDVVYTEFLPEVQEHCSTMRDERLSDWMMAMEDTDDDDEFNETAAGAGACAEGDVVTEAEPSNLGGEMIIDAPMADMTLTQAEESPEIVVD